MIGIPIGLACSNASEWLFHKHVLHGLGKHRNSFWAFHWHEHHKNARRNAHRDPAYEEPVFDSWAAWLSPGLREFSREGLAWVRIGPRSEAAREFHWNGQGKEALALAVAAVAVAPLLPVAPFFTATLWSQMLHYYRVHKRAHIDPAWAREHLPWHYDHHMGPDQDANWCVTRPWFDLLMGTRVPYVGTEREAQDLAKQAALAERRRRAGAVA